VYDPIDVLINQSVDAQDYCRSFSEDIESQLCKGII
jgi:hypothetical protein